MGNWFRWKQGRQNGGYSKLSLVSSKRFKFDAYIIYLPQGSVVKSHVDPVPSSYEHHRVNITLWKPMLGGETFIARKGYAQAEVYQSALVYHFRPDIQRHSVNPCLRGSLVLLSIGWLRRVAK